MSENVMDVVATVKKNVQEDVQVAWTDWNEYHLLDVRVWITSQIPGIESKPTKKGLRLRPEVWRELIAAVSKALDDYEAK